MKYRKIEQSRCPWCGEILVNKEMIKTAFRCDECNRFIKFKIKEFFFWICFFLGVLIALAILFGSSNLRGERAAYNSWACLPVFFYAMAYAEKLPFYRSKKEKNGAKERSLGRATIRWYPYKKGGIGFAHIRLLNNMIFPVCFVDAKGVPVSQTVCVRICRRFTMFWRRSKIKLISDDLWKPNKEGRTPWELAEKFVIFNNGEVVGEGIVKHKRNRGIK